MLSDPETQVTAHRRCLLKILTILHCRIVRGRQVGGTADEKRYGRSQLIQGLATCRTRGLYGACHRGLDTLFPALLRRSATPCIEYLRLLGIALPVGSKPLFPRSIGNMPGLQRRIAHVRINLIRHKKCFILGPSETTLGKHDLLFSQRRPMRRSGSCLVGATVPDHSAHSDQ